MRFIIYIVHFLLILSLIISCNKNGSSNDDELPDKNTNPYEQNAKLARSVNLGNALEAPAEGEWGVVLEQEFFTLIKEAGFRNIEIEPYDYRYIFEKEEDLMNYNVAAGLVPFLTLVPENFKSKVKEKFHEIWFNTFKDNPLEVKTARAFISAKK